jgi:hypothetical protein
MLTTTATASYCGEVPGLRERPPREVLQYRGPGGAEARGGRPTQTQDEERNDNLRSEPGT